MNELVHSGSDEEIVIARWASSCLAAVQIGK
jgi:hypothetical protein